MKNNCILFVTTNMLDLPFIMHVVSNCMCMFFKVNVTIVYSCDIQLYKIVYNVEINVFDTCKKKL